MGKVYVTQSLQRVLVKAEGEAKRLKDDYVSVEHLALSLLSDASVQGVLGTFGVGCFRA